MAVIRGAWFVVRELIINLAVLRRCKWLDYLADKQPANQPES